MRIFGGRSALRWWALTTGLVGASTAALVMWFVFAFAEGRITDPMGWLFVLFPLCSVAIAFKWPVVGGVLLILEGLTMTGLFGLAGIQLIGLLGSMDIQLGSTSWWLIVPLIAGPLLLTSGVLFLISRRQERKRGEV